MDNVTASSSGLLALQVNIDDDATTSDNALSEGLYFSQDDLGFSPDAPC